MSAQENKAVVARYLTGMLNEHNVGLASELFAEDHVSRSPHGPEMRGAESMARSITGLLKVFPDLTATIEDIVAEGDTVAVRLTVRGTHQGEFQGIAPTGKRVEFAEHQLLHLADGKIVARWFIADVTGVLRQLGAA